MAEYAKEMGVNGKLVDGHVPTWSIIVMDSSFSVKKEYCFQINKIDSRYIDETPYLELKDFLPKSN